MPKQFSVLAASYLSLAHTSRLLHLTSVVGIVATNSSRHSKPTDFTGVVIPSPPIIQRLLRTILPSILPITPSLLLFLNVERMGRSTERIVLPPPDAGALLIFIRRLVAIEARWIPRAQGCSLYIQPTLIGVRPSPGVSASTHAALYVISPTGPYIRDLNGRDSGIPTAVSVTHIFPFHEVEGHRSAPALAYSTLLLKIQKSTHGQFAYVTRVVW
ncbi:hypothetical protein H4582DRAFT_2076673 [Lactarius indigo]|nr:hypothetical protein H4582DRAFT_2076673 [Lactarius indigo]